jgi:hypothetical protein
MQPRPSGAKEEGRQELLARQHVPCARRVGRVLPQPVPKRLLETPQSTADLGTDPAVLMVGGVELALLGARNARRRAGLDRGSCAVDDERLLGRAGERAGRGRSPSVGRSPPGRCREGSGRAGAPATLIAPGTSGYQSSWGSDRSSPWDVSDPLAPRRRGSVPPLLPPACSCALLCRRHHRRGCAHPAVRSTNPRTACSGEPCPLRQRDGSSRRQDAGQAGRHVRSRSRSRPRPRTRFRASIRRARTTASPSGRGRLLGGGLAAGRERRPARPSPEGTPRPYNIRVCTPRHDDHLRRAERPPTRRKAWLARFWPRASSPVLPQGVSASHAIVVKAETWPADIHCFAP